MKKYKSVLDVILLLSLAIVSMLAIAPETFVMPTSVQMLILTIALVLIATFLVLLWRESPGDEREAGNQAAASRAAYVIGAIVLIAALISQSLKHHIDAAVPITLLAMIATKIFIQRARDGQ